MFFTHLQEATIFYKRLALCLSSKWDHPYSKTLSWLRSRITFSLLRSAIQCISEVPVPASDTQPDPTFHPLIWSALNSDPPLNSWPTHSLSFLYILLILIIILYFIILFYNFIYDQTTWYWNYACVASTGPLPTWPWLRVQKAHNVSQLARCYESTQPWTFWPRTWTWRHGWM